MSALSLDAAQAAIVQTSGTYLEQVFLDGAVEGLNKILPSIERYDKLNNEHKEMTRDIFRMALAATIKTLALPGLSTTVSYRAADGFSTGTLTFVNGILVSST